MVCFRLQVSVTNQNKVCLQFIRRGQHLASGGGSVGEIVQVSRNGMDVSLLHLPICRPVYMTTYARKSLNNKDNTRLGYYITEVGCPVQKANGS